MKKILHIANTNRFSGAENVICQIIGMFRDRYPEIEMVYVSRDGQIREALKERNIRFIPVESVSVKELKRVIKEERPDVVHAHDMKASVMAALVCRKIRLISHIHNNNFDSRGVSLKSLAYMIAGWKAHHIFWVSQSSFDGYCFHDCFKKKSSVLYNIIDVDALYEKMSLDEQEYNYDVCYVGRLTYQKDPLRLLSIIKKIMDMNPLLKVAIVGTGEMEDEVKRKWTEFDLKNNVNLLGFRPNPLKIIHSSKVMVMSSRWEGTPMCALESMALGTPIVSTPVDGMVDLIENDVTGYLSDNDDVLADRIVRIVSDDELRSRLSMNCIEDARRRNDISVYKEELKKAYNG